jgi:hypothetical protein
MKSIIDHIPSTEFGVEQIGDQSYKFKCVLFNKDNQHLVLRRGALETLVLNDDILKFYHYGYIDIKNPHNFLYRTDLIKDVRGEDFVNCFKLRNDPNLFIYLFLEPAIKGSLATDELNNETSSMEFIFAVTKPYLIPHPTGNPDLLTMRMEFEDHRQVELRTQLSDYSTKTLYDELTKDETNLPASEKNEVYTGEAVKDLLTKSLGPASKFSGMFDRGSFKTTYTSPGNKTYAYDLERLLGQHVSVEEKHQCPCLLKANRFVLDQEFSLTPLYDIYNHAYNHNTKTSGIYMTERFVLSEQDVSSDARSDLTGGRELFAPNDIGSYHFPDHSIISNYTFNDVQNITNATRYKPREAHNYDSNNKTFHISYIPQKTFDDEYLNNVSGPVVGSNQPTYNTHDYTNLNRTIEHYTTNDQSKAAAHSKNSKLYETIFNGNQLEFTARGGPWRRAMRFCSVETAGQGPGSSFNSKVCGQYLILNVKHEFNSSGYTNTVKATTPNNLDELGQSTGLDGYRAV